MSVCNVLDMNKYSNRANNYKILHYFSKFNINHLRETTQNYAFSEGALLSFANRYLLFKLDFSLNLNLTFFTIFSNRMKF